MEYKKKISEFVALYYGSFLSQGINLLVYFLAAGFLSLGDMADFFILISLTEVMSAAITMQSHMTIMIGRNKKRQMSNLICSSFITITCTLVLSVILLFVKKLTDLDMPFLSVLVYLPISVVLHGLSTSSEKYNLARRRSNRISLAKTGKVLVFAGTLLILFIAQTDCNILVVAYLSGQVTLVILLTWQHIRIIVKVSRSIRGTDLLQFFVKYKRILIYNTIVSPINVLSNQLPFLFIPFLYNKEFVANYGILFKTIFFPILLVSQINTQLNFRQYSALYNESKSIKEQLRDFVKRSLILGVLLYVFVTVASNLFSVFIDDQWQLSVSLLNVVIIWLVTNFVKTPISPLITIFNIQRKWMLFEIAQLLLRCLLFALCSYLNLQIVTTIAYYSLLSSILGVVLIVIIFKETDRYERIRC